MRDIATVMMKVSQNLYAETLLKALGAAGGGLGHGGRRTPRGPLCPAEVGSAGRWLHDVGRLRPVALRLCDRRHASSRCSSGCTRIRGTVTPSCRRLRSPAATARWRRASIETRAKDNVVAKTGSISNVRALSGIRAHARRRGPRVFHSRQRLRRAVSDSELHRRPRGGDPVELQPSLTRAFRLKAEATAMRRTRRQ